MTAARCLTNVISVAHRALRQAVGAPSLITGLYLVNLACTLLYGLSVARTLKPLLAGHPNPDIFTWALLSQQSPRTLVTVGWQTLAAILCYILTGSICAAVALHRMAPRNTAHGERTALHGALVVLPLRLTGHLAQAAILALWGGSAYAAYRVSLPLPDERMLMLSQLVVALPCSLLFLSTNVVAHYAQAIAILGQRRVFPSLRASISLVRHDPWSATSLWALKWIAWATLTALALESLPYTGPYSSQLFVVSKVFVTVWGWAAALTISQSHMSLSGRHADACKTA